MPGVSRNDVLTDDPDVVARRSKMSSRKSAMFLAAVTIAVPVFGQSISSDYSGLGDTPLGRQLIKQVPAWDDRLDRWALRKFLDEYRRNTEKEISAKELLSEVGFDCSDPAEQVCTYSGSYKYEMWRPGYPATKHAVRMDVSVDYSVEPWKIKSTREFLYGGPKKQ